MDGRANRSFPQLYRSAEGRVFPIAKHSESVPSSQKFWPQSKDVLFALAFQTLNSR